VFIRGQSISSNPVFSLSTCRHLEECITSTVVKINLNLYTFYDILAISNSKIGNITRNEILRPLGLLNSTSSCMLLNRVHVEDTPQVELKSNVAKKSRTANKIETIRQCSIVMPLPDSRSPPSLRRLHGSRTTSFCSAPSLF
jgi:hypothetical protein